MSLDINTPKGQQSAHDEQQAANLFIKKFPRFAYVHTPKAMAADCDALIVEDNTLAAIVETKCRYDLTLKTFQTTFESQWLVTFDKLERCRLLAKGMGVPFIGFLYLVEDKILLSQMIANARGAYVPNITIRKSETQRTINGGTIERINAYIDMTKCKTHQ